MPAYSYKERFVDFIQDGSKYHTIRLRRRYPAKIDDNLYHFYGLRTKYCRRLLINKCLDVKTIFILTDENIIITNRLKDDQIEILPLIKRAQKIEFFHEWEIGDKKYFDDYNIKILNLKEKNRLAYHDGFRSDWKGYEECFDEMYKWWTLTHNLPFVGDIIIWDERAFEYLKQ